MSSPPPSARRRARGKHCVSSFEQEFVFCMSPTDRSRLVSDTLASLSSAQVPWPLWLKPCSLELSVFVDTGLGVWFVVCVMFLSRSGRLSFSYAGVVIAALALERFPVRNG